MHFLASFLQFYKNHKNKADSKIQFHCPLSLL